jgi:hypothetical protein
VEAFLGRGLPEAVSATRTSRVPITWLRQHFAHCPEDADEQTVAYYRRAWILHLFGCVLFPDSTSDSASWMYITCLIDWDTTGMYSWGSGVLSFLYRHLCEACHRASQHASINGYVYLLQLWMWSPRWPAHSSCSTSMVRHGHPSTPTDGCLLMGPGQSSLRQEYASIRRVR